jgi:hypothetical protein
MHGYQATCLSGGVRLFAVVSETEAAPESEVASRANDLSLWAAILLASGVFRDIRIYRSVNPEKLLQSRIRIFSFIKWVHTSPEVVRAGSLTRI